MPGLPPPPTSRKARSTYDRLLESCHAVMQKTGSISPEAVTEMADVSTATFYTYFESKDHAVAATFDLSLGRMMSRLAEELTIERLLDEDLESVMHGAVRIVIDSFRADARIYRLALSRLTDSAMMREVYVTREREILAYLGAFVRRGVAAGRIRDEDPSLLASVMLVTMQGLQNPTLIRSTDRRLGSELASMLVWELSPRP